MRDVKQELQPFVSRLVIDQVRHFGQNLLQTELVNLEIELARFDLGQIQYVVDDSQQVLPRLLHFLKIVALARAQIRPQRQVAHADDGIHGGADFMAHIRQKGRFGRRGFFSPLARKRSRVQRHLELCISGFGFGQRPVLGRVKNLGVDQQCQYQANLAGREKKVCVLCFVGKG